jgi:signal transduction histidine kinase
MSSLRDKIISSYSLSNLAIITIALIVFADLNYLHSQITEGENVKDLLTATQQLQNDERNLYQCQEADAYNRLHDQFDKTENMYKQFRPIFEEVVDAEELNTLSQQLQHYRVLLESLQDQCDTELLEVQTELLFTSEAINQQVRDLGRRHHTLISQTTKLASWTLVIALSLVVVMGIVSALFVVRQVIRPIVTLERQLDAVADGEEKKLSLVSGDIEIQSFVQHFNSMLDRLRTQQRQLRHHEKAAALGVLVSGVAHELNNPLSNISTSVQLLLEDDSGASKELQQQWLTHVDSETDRARRIVRRLLDSVRQPKLNMQSWSASDVVRSAALLIHRQIDPSIFLHIEDVPDTCIQVDRERMQQLFINLIRNAVAAGSRNIWIFADTTTWEESVTDDIEHIHGEVSTISENEQLLLFTIADDGAGIPEDHLAHLFTPFFTTQSGGEGTGLGLYLVKEIVDEHHGCITVENRTDGGTQFLIWIPVAEEECEP